MFCVLTAPWAAAKADDYEDKCVMSASRLVPGSARVTGAQAAKASPQLVAAAQRDTSIRWIKVTLSVALAGRNMKQEYLCGRTPSGGYYSMPVE